MLIKQGAVVGEGSLKISTTGSPIKFHARTGLDKFGMPKKEKFKEYDLKTNKIVEVKKKKKVNQYEDDSDKSVER